MILSDFRVFSPPKLCLFTVVGVLYGLALFVVSWFLLASVTWCLQLLFCIFLVCSSHEDDEWFIFWISMVLESIWPQS